MARPRRGRPAGGGPGERSVAAYNAVEPSAVDDKPRLSVVVTSHNGQRFLAEQLRSIVNQSEPAHEIVVGDDASSDSSLVVAREALRHFGGDVHVLATEEHLGLSTNLTRCLERSSGDVIVFADQDDVWRADKLATIKRVLCGSPSAQLVFSDARLVGENGRPLGRSLWQSIGFSPLRQQWADRPVEVLARRTVVTGATMAVRRDLVDAALPFPAGCWHDEWLTLAAVLSGETPVAISETLIDYRLHGANVAGLPSAKPLQRLAQAGWPRDTRTEIWELACQRFGPSEAADYLREAVAFARRRPHGGIGGWTRAKMIAALGVRGDYGRYGNGWPTALYDLVAPVLFAGEQVSSVAKQDTFRQ